MLREIVKRRLTDHNGKDNGNYFDLFDDTESHETDSLDAGKKVNAVKWHMTEKHIVRLVLDRHEHDKHTLHHLCD